MGSCLVQALADQTNCSDVQPNVITASNTNTITRQHKQSNSQPELHCTYTLYCCPALRGVGHELLCVDHLLRTVAGRHLAAQTIQQLIYVLLTLGLEGPLCNSWGVKHISTPEHLCKFWLLEPITRWLARTDAGLVELLEQLALAHLEVLNLGLAVRQQTARLLQLSSIVQVLALVALQTCSKARS